MFRLTIALLVALIASPANAGGAPFGPIFIRGDVDGDGNVLINDAIFSLGVLFGPSAGFPCEDAADVNDTGNIDIADTIYLLSYLFAGGPDLPEPFPFCGPDFTDFDALFCFQPPSACIPPEVFHVLNAPSQVGAGNDSVVRVEVYADGTQVFEPILPADGTWNGIRFIEVPFDLLVVLQEDPISGENRLVTVDTFNGTIYSDITGIPGNVRGMAADDFSYGYLVVTDDVPSAQLLKIDLFGSDPPETLWFGPGEYDVRGVGVDWDENVYFAAVGPVESGIFKVDPAGSFSTLLELTEVGQLRFDPESNALSMLDQDPVGTMSIQIFALDGQRVVEHDLGAATPNPVGDYGLRFSGAYIPVPSEDQVLIRDFFGGSATSWTSADGIQYPVDVASPTLIAVP